MWVILFPPDKNGGVRTPPLTMKLPVPDTTRGDETGTLSFSRSGYVYTVDVIVLCV